MCMQFLVSFDIGRSQAEYCNSPYIQLMGDVVIVSTILGLRMGRVIDQRRRLDAKGRELPVHNNNTIIFTIDADLSLRQDGLKSAERESNSTTAKSVADDLKKQNSTFTQIVEEAARTRINFRQETGTHCKGDEDID